MITVLGLALGALFIVIPLLVAYIYGVGIGRRMSVALVKMLLRVGVLGAAVYFLVQAGCVWLSLLSAVAVVAYCSLAVCVKARLGIRQFAVPALAGMAVSVVVSGCVLLFANVSVGSDFCVRYVLPVVALLSGGMIEPVGKALAVYYMGLRHHGQLYYYLVGNGATRSEALRYLQRRAVEQSLVSGVKTLSAVGAGVSPVLMWTMLMCGRSAAEAVCWQVLVLLGVFASSTVALCVSVLVARRYVVDGYARLRVPADDEETAEHVAAEIMTNETNNDANE